MGQRSTGRGNQDAPYSRVFNTAQADLTSFVVSAPAAGQQQVAPYQNAASGAILFVTTAVPTFVYTNCAGESVSMTAAIAGVAVGAQVPIPVGMVAITTISNCSALVYWHGSTLP